MAVMNKPSSILRKSVEKVSWFAGFFSCLEIRMGDPNQKQKPWRYLLTKAVFFVNVFFFLMVLTG